MLGDETVLSVLSGELEVGFAVERRNLRATLKIPVGVWGLVLLVHGGGSGRFNPRNRYVADALGRAGIGTLLVDLMTVDEERMDRVMAHLRLDVELLAERVIGAIDWVTEHPSTRGMALGAMAAGPAAAAAVVAAVRRPHALSAVVARGGRPDLARAVLGELTTPTMLVVGERDQPLLTLNQRALASMQTRQALLHVVPEAGHAFEEPGALDEVVRVARTFFERFLGAPELAHAPAH